MFSAASVRARSFLSAVIFVNLTPGAGSSVNCVTVGPTCTDFIATSIPNCSSFSRIFSAFWRNCVSSTIIVESVFLKISRLGGSHVPARARFFAAVSSSTGSDFFESSSLFPAVESIISRSFLNRSGIGGSEDFFLILPRLPFAPLSKEKSLKSSDTRIRNPRTAENQATPTKITVVTVLPRNSRKKNPTVNPIAPPNL